jgi:hypothetical protein
MTNSTNFSLGSTHIYANIRAAEQVLSRKLELLAQERTNASLPYLSQAPHPKPSPLQVALTENGHDVFEPRHSPKKAVQSPQTTIPDIHIKQVDESYPVPSSPSYASSTTSSSDGNKKRRWLSSPLPSPRTLLSSRLGKKHKTKKDAQLLQLGTPAKRLSLNLSRTSTEQKGSDWRSN